MARKNLKKLRWVKGNKNRCAVIAEDQLCCAAQRASAGLIEKAKWSMCAQPIRLATPMCVPVLTHWSPWVAWPGQN